MEFKHLKRKIGTPPPKKKKHTQNVKSLWIILWGWRRGDANITLMLISLLVLIFPCLY